MYAVGEYIIYYDGYTYELGRITGLDLYDALVCFCEGEPSKKIPYVSINKLENRFLESKCKWYNEYVNPVNLTRTFTFSDGTKKIINL